MGQFHRLSVARLTSALPPISEVEAICKICRYVPETDMTVLETRRDAPLATRPYAAIAGSTRLRASLRASRQFTSIALPIMLSMMPKALSTGMAFR
jgi:hypothetical protein